MRLLTPYRVLTLAIIILTGTIARAQGNASPFLYRLASSAAAPGGPAFSLTANGTGFVTGAVVNWNGSPRPTTFVNSSQVTAAIAAADIATPGTVAITVTNPPPGGGTSNPQFFQVTFPSVGLSFQDSALSTGPYVLRTLVGDINGDGKVDLVDLKLVAGPVSSNYRVEILIGKGDGTFETPTTVINFPGGIQVFDLAVGDLNGDGKADLVGSFQDFSAFPYSSGTFTLLGNGDGTFQAPVVSDTDATGNYITYATQVADVNGDGIPDLVRACGVGVCVELGNGNGTFRRSFQYSVRTGNGFIRAQSVALGDFHRNGKLDIIVGFNYSNIAYRSYYLIMLPGNGDGTFGTASVLYEGLTSGGLDSLVVADFDNDGNLDLAFYYYAPQPTTLASSGTLSIMQGNGDGTFQPPLTLAGLPEGGGPNPLGLLSGTGTSVLVPGDFNGDGHVDLAVQNVVVLIGNGNGPFSYDVITLPSASSSFAAGDFNGDGRLDLVGIDSQDVHALLQTSVPGFVGSINDPAYVDVEPGETATYTITVTSLNGFAGAIQFAATGLPPGAAATFTPSTLVGSGTLTVTISTVQHTPTGSYPIIISGTSVGITHSGGITLNVGSTDERFEDFGGTVIPAFQTVVPGASTTYRIAIFPLNGFDSDVLLKADGLPSGATATFEPGVVAGGSGPSVLAITTLPQTPTGTYTIKIEGTATGGHVHYAYVSLIVTS